MLIFELGVQFPLFVTLKRLEEWDLIEIEEL